MSSHVVTGKPPKPSPRPAGAKAPAQPVEPQGGSGYVGRFKRLQRMKNQRDSTSSDIQKMIQKSLPRDLQISSEVEKNRMMRGVQRPNAMNMMPLPGVQDHGSHGNGQQQALTPRRQSLPMKTFHFRVNPEYSSFISRSLPSLPSIPGSPSYPEEQAISPMTDRVTEKDKAKVPVFPSKHRFEKIVVQKHLHGEPSSELIKASQQHETKATSRPHASILKVKSGWEYSEHGEQGHSEQSHGQWAHVQDDQQKLHTGGPARIRYSQGPRPRIISATHSEPSYEVSRKWKEDCSCLRCQMLKRQFQEGDSNYRLWGRYPCHHIDPTVMLDDD